MSQNDPQNGGRKNGPPDLDEVFRGLSDKLGRFFGGGNGERRPPSDGGSGFAATCAPQCFTWSRYTHLCSPIFAALDSFGQYEAAYHNGLTLS